MNERINLVKKIQEAKELRWRDTFLKQKKHELSLEHLFSENWNIKQTTAADFERIIMGFRL